MIGNFARDGELYSKERIKVNDHDFKSVSSVTAIPHGIYDLVRNIGYLIIGVSHDTSEFACDCISSWWKKYGILYYNNSDSILVLCDCGGSNNARYYIFKEQLQKLSDKIGIEIRIAHYPSYTSKYNPIEHRLFPHVTRACKGLIFDNIKILVSAMSKTATKTGLSVFVDIADKIYQTGMKYTKGFKENMDIVCDEVLSKWNYRAIPKSLAT